VYYASLVLSQRVFGSGQYARILPHWWVLTFCVHGLTSFSSIDTLCGDGLAWEKRVGFGQVVIIGESSLPLDRNAELLIVLQY